MRYPALVGLVEVLHCTPRPLQRHANATGEEQRGERGARQRADQSQPARKSTHAPTPYQWHRNQSNLSPSRALGVNQQQAPDFHLEFCLRRGAPSYYIPGRHGLCATSRAGESASGRLVSPLAVADCSQGFPSRWHSQNTESVQHQRAAAAEPAVSPCFSPSHHGGGC